VRSLDEKNDTWSSMLTSPASTFAASDLGVEVDGTTLLVVDLCVRRRRGLTGGGETVLLSEAGEERFAPVDGLGGLVVVGELSLVLYVVGSVINKGLMPCCETYFCGVCPWTGDVWTSATDVIVRRVLVLIGCVTGGISAVWTRFPLQSFKQPFAYPMLAKQSHSLAACCLPFSPLTSQ
jgi:hypothetical protein